jgi:DNA end-binding protein Ku
MQAIWKGSVSFGLVSIPVRLYSATDERNIAFRQVHEKDGGRIRYHRYCEEENKEVPYSEISKGYELPDGRMVILSSEDFEQLPLPTAKQIEVLEFVPIEQVDPIMYSKAYYLSADGPGAKPYVLLRDALEKSGQCAVVKVAIRTREALALLRVSDGVLVMQTMLWPDEVRDSGFAKPDDSVAVNSKEVEMAESYIRTLETEFDPDRYRSDYREALEELIEAKTAGLAPPSEDEEETTSKAGDVIDLVAALRASVDAAKKRRAGASGSSSSKVARTASSSARAKTTKKTAATKTATTKKSTAKKTPSKRTAASGTAAKTTAAKQAAAKKSPAKSTAKSATAKKTAAKRAVRKSA